MNYEALRAVFTRVNEKLGTNYHARPAAHRGAADGPRRALSIRDVQKILGHAHLSTTADIYLVEDEAR